MDLLVITEILDKAILPKTTLIGIVIGAVLGIVLGGFLGWGVIAIFGRKQILTVLLVVLILLLGFLGAIVGDAKAAPKRPLNRSETRRAYDVFGESLDYKKIKLATFSRLMTAPRRQMCRAVNNTIYLSRNMSNKSLPDSSTSIYTDLLIHELTHCWQIQNGIPFRKQVATALRVVFNRRKPYNYGGSKGLWEAIAAKKNFRDFNTEQQGDILRDYYCKTRHFSQKADTLPHTIFYRQVQFNNGFWIETDSLQQR
jgi:uncharacterized membrane protein